MGGCLAEIAALTCCPRTRWRGSIDSGLPELEEAQRIHADGAVAHHPMQMGSGDAPGRAHQADLLAGGYRVPSRNILAAQMEVAADQPLAVIDVDHAAGEVEGIDQCDDAARSSAHRRAHCAG